MTASGPTETMAPPLAESSSRKQKAYARKRRAWAAAVGRPYEDERDLRPPPGELDAAAEDDA